MAAYRKQHCCETTLIRLVEDQKTTADRKERVTELSTHMSKTFDPLYPALMIQNLKAYSFPDASINLKRSFFELRRNQINLQEVQSSWKEQTRESSQGKEQTRGSPKGSSFIPLVWNLFQNHLPVYAESESLFMYGDDHQVYMTG